MPAKCHKLEEIVSKLRQVDVLVGQGLARVDAIRQVSIAELTYCRPLSVMRSITCRSKGASSTAVWLPISRRS
jgi:hypothetical protein